MRSSAIVLFILLGVIALPGESQAEKVKANQETKLYARPGERGKVIASVSSGKAMTVLGKDGRWLKVRVAGRTGYVARSTVDMPDGEEMARNTRRRSFVDLRGTKRGFGGQQAPDDRIGADATGDSGTTSGGDDADDDADADDDDDKPSKPSKPAKASKPAKGDDDDDDEDANRKRVRVKSRAKMYNDPSAKSEEILVATRETLLFPTGEKKGEWTEVENDEGDLGYVRTAELESVAAKAPKARDDDDDDDDEKISEKAAPAVGAGRGGSQIDVRARAGVTLLTQGLRSPGAGAKPTVPDNYNIAASAVTVALGGGYYRPYGKSYVLGVEAMYDYANAFGGINTPPIMTGGANTKTKISMHNLNLRGVFGLDLKRPSGMMVLGRLGYQYHSFQIADVASTSNTARLPSEIIQSPMIGAAFAMPRLGKKIGVRFSLDVMPLNISYSQTKNLEDGKSPAKKAALVGAGLTYRWRPSMDIQATYDLTFAKVSFGDKVTTSMRNHPEGGVTRTDLFHAVTVGIVKAF